MGQRGGPRLSFELGAAWPGLYRNADWRLSIRRLDFENHLGDKFFSLVNVRRPIIFASFFCRDLVLMGGG